jgi:mono/diheme cytochrome c family protein
MKLFSLLPLVLLTACVVEQAPFKEGKILAGKKVDADTLNLGHTTYVEYCVQCHGLKGEGNGPAAKGLLPPPRNFTQGLYKFAHVPYGELPHDEDFVRIIRKGLKGTAMLPWDISDERLDAVIQYIKTFAPAQWEGADKVPGTKLELAADPWGEAKKTDAIERGKRVYHVTANCIQCHRGYETKANIMNYGKETKTDVALDDTLYQLKVQDGEYNYKVVPPDYSYHTLRTIETVEDIAWRVTYGVTGSGMPGFKDVVPDEDIWAVAYYVDSIRALSKDNKARQELLDRINTQK